MTINRKLFESSLGSTCRWFGVPCELLHKLLSAQAVGKHLYGAGILLVTTVLWASGGPTTRYLFLLPAPPSAALLTTCISVVTALFLVAGLLGTIMDGGGGILAWRPELEAEKLGREGEGGGNDDVQLDQAEAEAEALLHSGVHSTGAAGGAGGAALTAARLAGQQQQQHHRLEQRQRLQQGGADPCGDHEQPLLTPLSSIDVGSPAAAPLGFREATPSPNGPKVSKGQHDGCRDPNSIGSSGSSNGAASVAGPRASSAAAACGSRSRTRSGSWRLGCLTAPARSLTAAGMELGVYNVMAAALGAWGMQRISATRSAFLAQATSLITPLLVWLSGGRVGLVVWLACCCGALGGAMVALDNVYNGAAEGSAAGGTTAGTGPADGNGQTGPGSGTRRLLMEMGRLGAEQLGLVGVDVVAAAAVTVPAPSAGWDADGFVASSRTLLGESAATWSGPVLSQQAMGALYVVLSCVFWGLGTVRLGSHSARFRPLHLAAAAAVAYAGLSVGWLLSETMVSPSAGLANFLEMGVLLRNPVSAALLLWAGLGPGALSSYLQVLGQQTVPPAQAQVLFSSTPLWSALIAQLLLPGEAMGPLAWAGGAVMLGASLLASLWQ